MKYLAIAASIILASCSEESSHPGQGDFNVDMYSGGQKIRQWTSAGKVLSTPRGYKFHDKKTGEPVEISGHIVITPK